MSTNLRIDFFDLLVLVDGAEHLEEDSSSLVGLPELGPAGDIGMGLGVSRRGIGFIVEIAV